MILFKKKQMKSKMEKQKLQTLDYQAIGAFSCKSK